MKKTFSLFCSIFVLLSCLGAQTSLKVLGDSISAGTWLSNPTQDRYPKRLADALGVTEVNAAQSGGCLTDRSYVPHMFNFWEGLFLTGSSEDYCLIFLGVNDHNYIQANPEKGVQYVDRLNTIVNGLINYGYHPERIFLCAPYYHGAMEPSRTTVWNAVNDTAQQYGTVFVDFFALWPNQYHNEYMVDGLHPNPAGAEVMKNFILTAIDNHIPGGNLINQSPVLAPIGPKSTPASQPLQFQINATDPDGDPLTFSATSE